jgi:hypothetical protein
MFHAFSAISSECDVALRLRLYALDFAVVPHVPVNKKHIVSDCESLRAEEELRGWGQGERNVIQ